MMAGSSPTRSGGPPSLGAWSATEEAWARAHRVVVDRLAGPQSVRALAAADFVGFYRAYQLRWVVGMCELLGLPTVLATSDICSNKCIADGAFSFFTLDLSIGQMEIELLPLLFPALFWNRYPK